MTDRTRQGRRARGALVAGVVSVLLAATACAGSGSSGNNSGNSNSNFVDNATVNIAGALVGTDLDPYKAGGQLEDIINIYDSLITPQFDLSLKPGLATAWTWSPDNEKLTLTLRQGVKFSDGTPFDSSAVVASLNRARNGSTSTAKSTLAPITDVEANGPNTVVIVTKQPYVALPAILASPAGMVINPKMINNDDAIAHGALGVGTGPYIVDTFKPTTILTLTKRTDYWDEASIKHAPAKFVYNYVLDGNARLNGLRSGQYDIIQAGGTPGIASPGILPPGTQLNLVPSMYVFGLSFAFDRPPFNNIKVRQAIQHGIDWNAIVSKVLTDAMLALPQPVGQIALAQQLGYNPNFKFPTYDPNMAKQLLSDAGFPGGAGLPPITITSSTASGDIAAAQAMQPMLAAIGVKIGIDQQASSIYEKAQLKGGQANMISLALTSGGGIDIGLTYNVGILGSFSWVDKSSPPGQQFVNLIQQAGVTTSNDQRNQLYQQAEQLAQDNAFYIPFCRTQVGFASNKKIGGIDNTFYARNSALLAAALTVSQ